MAVKTQMRTTLPPCWMHEAFNVEHYRFVWCVRTERLRSDHRNRVCIKNKQATQTPHGSQSFYTVSMKWYVYVQICVCVLWLFSIFVTLILNFNVIIRHAIQTNRGSTHTYGSLLHSGSNRHRRPATQHPTNINKATEDFGPLMPEYGETLRFAWMAWPYYFLFLLEQTRLSRRCF